MLANHRPASGLISRIGKGSQQHNSTVVQKSEQMFLLRHTNGQQHMKRCSPPLIIREMEIRTTMRYHITQVRMAIIKKSTNNKCWRGSGEKGTVLQYWWECKWVQP